MAGKIKEKQKKFYGGKIALITGVTSGIGRALAMQMVNLGATVFGVSRSEKKLSEVATQAQGYRGRFIPFAEDISSKENCQKVFEAFSREFPALDILINNAGLGHFAPFEQMSLRDYEYVMNTNLMAPIHLTSLFLDYLKKNRNSRIINICSSGAFYGVPYRSIYCASKAGMRAWSQAMALELERYGIKVIWVIPGATRTSFFENSLGRAPQTHRIPDKVLSPEILANKILTAAMKGSGELQGSLSSRVVLMLSVFVPAILKKIIRHMAKSEEEHIYGKERNKYNE